MSHRGTVGGVWGCPGTIEICRPLMAVRDNVHEAL